MRQRSGIAAEVPAHGDGQVSGLGLQPIQPLALAGAAQVRFRLFGQRPVVIGVAALHLDDVGPGGQPFGDEHADGLQHPAPEPIAGAVGLNQAVPDQRLG